MYYLRPTWHQSSYNYRRCRTTIKLLRSQHCTGQKWHSTSIAGYYFVLHRNCLHEKTQWI